MVKEGCQFVYTADLAAVFRYSTHIYASEAIHCFLNAVCTRISTSIRSLNSKVTDNGISGVRWDWTRAHQRSFILSFVIFKFKNSLCLCLCLCLCLFLFHKCEPGFTLAQRNNHKHPLKWNTVQDCTRPYFNLRRTTQHLYINHTYSIKLNCSY